MKISHHWLQTLIPLSETPQQISHWLTALGLEVESIETVEKIKGNLEGMVIGEVLTCEKHPDADKLKITTVDAGGAENLQIVCGAPNVATGQKVVVATVGAILYPIEGESFQIKKSKIRGQLSEGMICAEDEIGLGKGHDGIMVLDTALPNGTPAIQYFNLAPEFVYEIGLTPNRVDAASHYGVARDLRALLNRPVHFPKTQDCSKVSTPNPVQIRIEESGLCKRYACLMIENVTVKASADWVQNALKSIGLNPINNLVDATNFVLHELGQPLHAFDADLLADQQIVVRNGKSGEKLITLDKKEIEIRESDLVIADGQKPIALAGIMGGLESSVNQNTNRILIESAWFDPGTVRKSSQHHGIKTDSSFRFERGCDPNMAQKALERMAFLVLDSCPEAQLVAYTDLYPQPIENQKFAVKWANINRLIGEEIPRETIHSILNGLEIKTTPINDYGHPGFEEEMEVEVPTYRVDVTREADLVEDIIRVYGLDNISMGDFLKTDFISGRETMKPEKQVQRAAQFLADSGFTEIVTNSLTNPQKTEGLEGFKLEDYVPILNRLSEDLSVMRQTLLFSGLEVLAYNINRRQSNLRLFEFGKVYRKQEEKFKEGYRLALFQTGLLTEPSWETSNEKANYFHLQKAVLNLFTRLNFGTVQLKPEVSEWFEYGQAIYLKNQKVGEMGLLKSEICRKNEVKQTVTYAELDWDKLIKLGSQSTKIQEIIKFPEVRRDLSVVIDKNLTFDKLEQIIRQSGKQIIQKITVFDVYEGDKIEAGKKAYAMSITLQDEKQTLTDEAIDKTIGQIMNRLEKELGALIRK